jgi:hypothetical protein
MTILLQRITSKAVRRMAVNGPTELSSREVVIFLIFGTPNQNAFQNSHKAVILSEAPRRSIAQHRVYGAESKSLSRAKPREPRGCLFADALQSFPATKTGKKSKKSQPPTGAYPDFLLRGTANGHVCGFPQRKPHEVRQRHQPRQEIRGSVVEGPFDRLRAGSAVSLSVLTQTLCP